MENNYLPSYALPLGAEDPGRHTKEVPAYKRQIAAGFSGQNLASIHPLLKSRDLVAEVHVTLQGVLVQQVHGHVKVRGVGSSSGFSSSC